MLDAAYLSPQRALVSVHDKTGLVTLCRGLEQLGIDILASQGTAQALSRVGIGVTSIQAWTGSPEVLDGRVKSLHPKLHAGILADRRRSTHMQQLQAMHAAPIDIVVCNLYPFAERWAAGESRATLIENIDVGGPTLLRAAAKNMDAGVLVVCDVADYSSLLEALHRGTPIGPGFRAGLAAKAFRRVANYDLAIASWCETPKGRRTSASMPEVLGGFIKTQNLRYGENPDQAAALYRVPQESGVASGRYIQGPLPSYTNVLDLDTAWRAAHGIARSGCSVVKHTNLCGLAAGHAQGLVLAAALAGNPQAIAGATLGFNTPVQADTIQALLNAKYYLAGIVAPAFSSEALQLAQAMPHVCLLEVSPGDPTPQLHAHRIGGGLLLQQALHMRSEVTSWRCVTQQAFDPSWQAAAKLAVQAASLLKSDAVSVVQGCSLVGAAGGQVSRIDAVSQSLHKAGNRSQGAILASDGAFPLAECVHMAVNRGILGIVQPGGASTDGECIAACDAHGVAMLFTGQRCFRH